jgi:C4-dicarboxylate-specific signal transduction histidine kinase
MYILTIALLAVAVYLRSPLTAIAVVGLWGLSAAEAVFTRKNRDADITEIIATISAHKAQMATLTRDITNVAERARTILGENF